MSDLPRYPDTTGKDVTKRIDELENYIINLHRFLRFALETIDEKNMTAGARGQFLEIKGLYTELYADETGLLSRMTNAEGGVSTLQQNVNGLTSTVQANTGDIFDLQGDVLNAEGNISTLGQNMSTLTQTVQGFSLDVTNGLTSSTIKLKSGEAEFSSQTISMNGLVKFTDLATAGSTTINGANITAGTLTLNSIESESGDDVLTMDSGGFKVESTHQPAEGDPAQTTIYKLKDGQIQGIGNNGIVNSYVGVNPALGVVDIYGQEININGGLVINGKSFVSQCFIGISRASGQTIAGKTITKLLFTTTTLEENDPLSVLTPYSSGIRCISSGHVKIWGTVDLSPSTSNTAGEVGYIMLYKNGAATSYYTRIFISLNNQTTFNFDPIIINVTANDYFNFYMYAPVGGVTGSGAAMRMYAEYMN